MVSFTLGYMHMSPDQVEQIKTPDHIDTPKTVKDVETQSVIDLFAIELDTNKNLIVPEELKDIVDDVMQDPQQPPEQEDQEKIGDMLKKWKISEAVSKALDMIFSIFAGSKKKAWLEDFKKYTTDYSSMTQEKLDETINWLQNRVKQSWLSIHQKLRFTYAFSRAKDEKTTRENPQSTSLEKLSKNIRPGDVLLINKWVVEWIWAKAIESIQGGNEFTHVMIVKEIKSNGEIIIIHSTTDKGVDGRSGVQESSLQHYIQKYKNIDILSLAPEDTYRDKLLQSVEDKLWYDYSKKQAAEAVLGDLIPSDSNAVTCVTLITESLIDAYPEQFTDLAKARLPKNLMDTLHLTPTYLTNMKS